MVACFSEVEVPYATPCVLFVSGKFHPKKNIYFNEVDVNSKNKLEQTIDTYILIIINFVYCYFFEGTN